MYYILVFCIKIKNLKSLTSVKINLTGTNKLNNTVLSAKHRTDDT